MEDNASASPLLAPTNPGLISLINSIFEPNFLILVGYLIFNLHLAFKVIKIATKRYATDIMTPLDETMQQHLAAREDDEKDDSSAQNTSGQDTPSTDTLVRISAWAFKADAANAKRILALMALVSLSSTWHYMIRFLHHSYLSYIEICHLTSYPLPPLPPTLDLNDPTSIIPALHLRVLRISQWLSSLSLFKEAWMEVIKDRTSWWWSSEICIITVGTWALFLRQEAKRLRIPHVWTCMALGQLVAISFAFNLFNLAIVYRLDTFDLVAARSDTLIHPGPHVIEPLESLQQEPEPEQQQQRPRSVAQATVSPDSAGADSGSASASASPARQIERIVTTVTIRRVPLTPKASKVDRLGALLASVIPETFGLPLFVLGGLYSVLQHPDTFTKVMVMHLFPMLIAIYPLIRRSKKALLSSRFGQSIRQSSPAIKSQLLHFLRSEPPVHPVVDPKVTYIGLGLVSLSLRAWLTFDCYRHLDNAEKMPLPRIWQLAQTQFDTFFRHPAQSSISSDHVCVAASTVVYIILESGLWLWKVAKASPSAVIPSYKDDKAASSTIRLDAHDRKLVEAQATFVVVLLLLSPLLGGSATLSFYLALRCSWIEQYERNCQVKKDAIRDVEEEQDFDMMAKELEGEVIENEEGERVLELRETKVAYQSPSSQASPPRDRPNSEESPSVSAGPGRRETRHSASSARTRQRPRRTETEERDESD